MPSPRPRDYNGGERKMSGRQTPVLSQFAVAPTSEAGVPSLVVDRVNGLLYETGSDIPFVEVLIHAATKWHSLVEMSTLLTEATDTPDPDLIRDNDIALSRVQGAVSTMLTKAVEDAADPDLLRLGSLRQFIGAVETLHTRQAPDPSDPDLVRTGYVGARSSSDKRFSLADPCIQGHGLGARAP